MTSAATTTQYLKETTTTTTSSSSSTTTTTPIMSPHHHNHNHPHSNHATTSNSNHHGAEAQELELNFLSEFLMHEDFAHDSSALVHVHAGNSYMGQEMKLEQDASYLHRQNLILQQYQFQQQTLPPHSKGPSSPHSTSSSGGEPLDRKAKRRQQVAISARRHRSRKKHELLDLRKEVSVMTQQLEFLRSKHKMMRPNSAVAEWEEKAMAQRRKRRQAESQSEELRRAIFLQSQFLSNLKSVFSSSPMFTEDLNLRQLLHTYTRLGRNPRSRQRDYEWICQHSKLQMATDILRRQTESIRFSTPFVKTQVIDSVDTFGATIVSVYAFDTKDVLQVFRATCDAIKESSNAWPEFTDTDGQHEIVDVLPKSNIVYGKQTTRYTSEPSSTNDATEIKQEENEAVDASPPAEIVVETRVISSWHVTEHEAVLMWDFVDDDDLHPVRADCDVKRDMIGATLVRRELCEDGKERVVCRSICSKLHTRLCPQKPTVVDANVLTKFATSPSRSLTRMCGNVVYKSIQKATANLTL